MAEVATAQLDWNPDMAREVRLYATDGNSGRRRTIEIETHLFYDELKELVCVLAMSDGRKAVER